MGNEFAIVIVNKGWVFYGEIEESEKGIIIRKCKNIRVWGTSKGLGELALSGPTNDTILDDYGTIRIPLHAIIGVIETKEILWKK